MQRQPAHLMAHNLHDKHPSVGRGSGMDTVDGIGGDIHGALEAEGHIRSPEVIINGLWEAYYV